MKMNDRMLLAKLAQQFIDIGDSAETGKEIADVIKFMMKRVDISARPFRIEKLRHKLIALNEIDIASKTIPESAVLGQCISMVKNLLNGQNSHYVRQTIKSIISNL